MLIFLILVYFISLLYLNVKCEENICGFNSFCDKCKICGINSTNICNDCNFNNIYCKRRNSSIYGVLEEFLLNYDGCIISNEEAIKACGNPELKLNEIKKLSFNKVYSNITESDIFCFYKYNESNNKKNERNFIIDIKGLNKYIINKVDLNFDIYLIITYINNEKKFINIDNNNLTLRTFKIALKNIKSISIYFDASKSNIIIKDKLQIMISDNRHSKNTEFDKIINYIEFGNKTNNKFIYYSFLYLVIGFVIVILLTYVKCDNFPFNKEIEFIKNSKKDNKLNENYIEEIFHNKVKSKKYFSNIIEKDNPNCTICLEKFNEDENNLVFLGCGHIFHCICLRNYLNKENKINKCPNCNEELKPFSENKS